MTVINQEFHYGVLQEVSFNLQAKRQYIDVAGKHCVPAISIVKKKSKFSLLVQVGMGAILH